MNKKVINNGYTPIAEIKKLMNTTMLITLFGYVNYFSYL